MTDNSVEIRVRVNDQSAAGLRGARSRARREGQGAGNDFTSGVSAGLKGLSTLGEQAGSAFSSVTSALGGMTIAGNAIPAVAGLAAALSQLAGAALVLPGVLSAGAAAMAAFQIGTAGVMDAITAKAPSGGGGGGGGASAATAISNAKAIRSAQDQIVTSQRAVVTASKQVEAAQRGVAAAERAVVDATHQATIANRNYQDALQSEKQAQADVQRARADATRQLQDSLEAVSDAALGQEGADLSLARAQENLIKVQKDVKSTALDLEEAQYQVKVAQEGVSDAATTATRAQQDNAEAQAKGVDGADSVVSANAALVSAQEAVADAAYGVQQANQGVIDAQQGVVDANDQLAAAQQGVVDAQHAADEAVQNLADTYASQAAQAGTASAGVNAYADALAKLSPNARAFVEAVRGLAPAWKDVTDSVQDNLFAGLAGDVQRLAGTYFPVLKTGLSDITAGMNGMARAAVDSLMKPSTVSAVNTVLENTGKIFGNLRTSLGDVLEGFLKMSAIGSDFLPQLGTLISDVAAKFKDWVNENPDKIRSLIQGGIDAFKDLFAIVGDVGSVISSVFTGLTTGASVGTLATVRGLADGFAELMKSKEVQKVLADIGETLRLAGEAGGAILLQVLLDLIIAFEVLKPAIDVVLKLMKDLAPILAPLVVALGGLFVAGKVASFALDMVKAFEAIKSVVAMIKEWTIVQGILNLVMDANPIGLIVLAIAALIGLAVLVIANWETIGPMFAALWQGIVDNFNLAIQTIVDVCVGFLGMLSDFGAWIWGLLSGLWQPMVDGVVTACQWAIDTWNGFLGMLADFGGWIWGLLAGLWQPLMDGLGSAIDWAYGLWAGFQGMIGDAAGWIGGVLGGMWDGLTAGAKIAANGAIGILNGLIAAANGVVWGLNLINPFGQIPSIPYVPYLAKGGIAGGMAVVGEQGRELVKLPQGSTVIPHGQSENMIKDAQNATNSRGGLGGPLQLVVAPGADSALASMLMGLVRTGQLQLQPAN